MEYEKQKRLCANYAQENGGAVSDVVRVSGRKGAVVLSKDGRVIYDPFIVEAIASVVAKEPEKPEQKPAVEPEPEPEPVIEQESGEPAEPVIEQEPEKEEEENPAPEKEPEPEAEAEQKNDGEPEKARGRRPSSQK